MILAFDIGNTHIVMGLYDGLELAGRWRIDSNPERTVDDYGHLVLSILQRAGADSKVDGVVIGSVVPTLTYVFEKLGRRYFEVEPVLISGDTELGIVYDVDAPASSIGADRIANAVAVRERYATDCIVVDMGTATTFDLISADGTYHGGVISPGISTSAESLISRASMLSRVKIEAPPKVIGRDTISMMQSGIFYGAICQIDGLVERLKAEWGKPCRVIATGGFVTMLAKFSREFDTVDPNLTLDGLRLSYQIVTGH
ncbi:MAG: type III pantothenate kinase [Candidatus Glassbacteria bacterium]|nr:type III pantothenate kinase [Candidatus Glassbacteria bacterium]